MKKGIICIVYTENCTGVKHKQTSCARGKKQAGTYYMYEFFNKVKQVI